MTPIEIKTLRFKKGYSQPPFADACGITVRWLSELECGRGKPSAALVKKMLSIPNYNSTNKRGKQCK